MATKHRDINTSPAAIVPGQILYSPAQAAAILSLGNTTLYELVNAGKIQALKMGRRGMFHRDELVRFASTMEVREVKS